VTKVDGRLIADGKAGKMSKEASELYLKSVGALVTTPPPASAPRAGRG